MRAYLLRCWAYQERSLIAELWTELGGKVRVMVPPSHRRYLHPFVLLWVSFRGDRALKRLQNAEALDAPQQWSGEDALCGYYVNELLVRLLEPAVEYPDLFLHYTTLMQTLFQGTPQLALRRFEMAFLEGIGYGLPTRSAVVPTETYCFDPTYGFRITGKEEGGLVIEGEALCAMIDGNFQAPQVNQLAKKVVRAQIKALLHGRPLESYTLFLKYRGIT